MWKVIAADDEGYIREALQKLINWEKMDCSLESVVSDGQELLEKIRGEMPDIVITDIQMPGVDGLEVCEYAKRAIKYSGCEYVLKISIIDELPLAVEKAIGKLSRLKKEIEIQEHTKAEEPESLLDQIEQYLEENFRKKITLDDIADTLHVNRSYLSRYYKNKTGVNLFDEILMKRVEKAKEYLQNTEMKTYEISEAVGVEDAGYVSKMFKKITGVSPKEFRKREQHEEKN